MKRKIYTGIISCACLFLGCSDYLNVSDQLSGGLQDIDQIFENVNYTKRFYANVFNNIPDYSGIVNTNGFKNPWTSLSDEVLSGYGETFSYTISDKNAANTSFHRWSGCYAQIRQANILLSNIHEIREEGTQADVLLQDEVDKMKANTRFMRAFYHYMLFEQYGPIPLVKDKIFEATESLDIPRNSMDEVLEYLDIELKEVAEQLTDSAIVSNEFRAWPTKGVALAVRAKMWVYAASPLFNGGYKEALGVSNNDGKSLFPAEDKTKWNKALAALTDFIDFAHQGNYELYTTGDPEKDVYDLFQNYTSEIIWATSSNDWGGMDGDAFDRRSTPRSETNGLGCMSVYQELVDDFYMSDGLPIKATSYLPASPNYSEEGQTKVNGVNVYNMWVNREPRFYNTVFFQARKWHVTNNPIYFYNGSSNDKSGQHAKSGYLLYKRFNRTVNKKSPGVASKFRPSIIFRLADMYLLYAEVINEITPNDPKILLYINKVRERAGLPNLETLNPSIKGDKAKQRAAIQRERRVELATEGQRYFDVRRWMIAETKEGRQNGEMHGMNLSGTTNVETDFYARTRVETVVFNRKMYLHPIPYSEMQKTKNLRQNPGW